MFSGIFNDASHNGSEANFIQLFKAGDAQVFACIYQQLYQPLTWSAKSIINSAIDAEDIAATAFLKLYTRGRKEINSLEYIRRWMFIVVRNDSINFLRRQSKERAVQRDIAYSQHLKQDFQYEKPENLIQYQAINELEKLPKQAKAVLQLYYFREKNTKQIAALLNLSGQTVLNHKTKALQSLRRRVTCQPGSM
jgi:RNA polymerase sigma factor (sigma-70 family)